MKTLFIFLSITFCFSLTTLAVVGDVVKISGYVKSYNESDITLESGENTFTVPRKNYSKHLAPGHKIEVEITKAELEKISQTSSKQKK